MCSPVSEKVAFITGSSRGIGYGIAQELNREGYITVLSGTSPAEKTASTLQNLSHKYLHFLLSNNHWQAVNSRLLTHLRLIDHKQFVHQFLQ